MQDLVVDTPRKIQPNIESHAPEGLVSGHKFIHHSLCAVQMKAALLPGVLSLNSLQQLLVKGLHFVCQHLGVEQVDGPMMGQS